MHFTQLLTILRARVRVIAMTTFCALLVGVLAIIMMPTRYEASASVMLDPRGADSVWASAAPGSGGDKLASMVSTHLDILANPAVALRAVELLRLESDPRAVELLSGSGPSAWLAQLKSAVLDALADVLAAREQEAEGDQSLKDWMADRLLRNVSTRSKPDSRLIRVTYSSPDAEFSAAAANAFLAAYQDTMLQLKVQPAKQSTKWFEEQVGDLKRQLELAEGRLAQFQQTKHIVATDERMDLENARLAELSAQLSLVQSQSYESQAKQRRIQDFMAGKTRDPPPEVLSSHVVQQLQASLADREAKMGHLAKRIGPNHPQYQATAGELGALKEQLGEAMRAVAQSALAGTAVAGEHMNSLHAALERQRSRVLSLKADRNKLSALARDVDHARRAYSTGVDKMTQARMESQVDQGSESVLYSATPPPRPAGPGKAVSLTIALLAGLALGIGLALLAETLNRYVRSDQDITELLGAPVLAVLVPKGAGRRSLRALERRVHALPNVQGTER